VSEYQLLVTDETGQREENLATDGSTRWAEVGAMSVERMGMPTHMDDGEDVIYHLFEHATGRALLPQESVADVVQEEIEVAFRVRLAAEMKPALRVTD